MTDGNAQIYPRNSGVHRFSFVTKDSVFSIQPGLRLKIGYDLDHLRSSGRWTEKVGIYHARVMLGGVLFAKGLEYYLELGKDRDRKGLLDAYLSWMPLAPLRLSIGQMKFPGNRESLVYSRLWSFIGESHVNDAFTMDRDLGVQLQGKLSLICPLELTASISTGEGLDTLDVNPSRGWQYTLMLEVLPLGDFDRYVGSDLKKHSTPKVSIATVLDYNDDAIRSLGTTGPYVLDSGGEFKVSDIFSWYSNFLLKYAGWNVDAEYYRRINKDALSAFGSGTGWMASTGYLFGQTEVVLRYASLRPDSFLSGLEHRIEYLVGINHYILGHEVKWQIDGAYNSLPALGTDFYHFRFALEMGF